MFKIPIKIKIAFVICGLLLLMISIIAGIIIPSARYIKKLRADIIGTQTFSEKNYQRSQQLKKSIKELTNIYERTTNMKRMTIEKEKDLALIKQFEDLAERLSIGQNVNLEFQEGTKTEVQGVKDGGHYIFTFHNQGTFENHLAYLKTLETWPIYVIIDNLSFISQNNPETPDRITLNFTAKMYTR